MMRIHVTELEDCCVESFVTTANLHSIVFDLAHALHLDEERLLMENLSFSCDGMGNDRQGLMDELCRFIAEWYGDDADNDSQKELCAALRRYNDSIQSGTGE